MIIEMVGVIHFDPLCRDRYIDWLSNIKSKYINQPSYIAIEWEKDIFERVKSQRGYFRKILKEKYPNSDEISINKLTLTLAFEGDSHLYSFPSIPIIWLDRNVVIYDHSIIDNYAEDRLNIYSEYLLAGNIINNNDLVDISVKAWNKFYSPDNSSFSNTDRDSNFFDILTNNVDNKQNSWVIVIIGASHTKENIGRLAYLLKQDGYDVIINLLDFNFRLKPDKKN